MIIALHIRVIASGVGWLNWLHWNMNQERAVDELWEKLGVCHGYGVKVDRFLLLKRVRLVGVWV